ncbi:ABC transporter permease [Vibrio hannami]|nr:ABC transporter permease [Vibrio hannami]MDG3088664.1 ABC transporter permease [Vibrio hannami]
MSGFELLVKLFVILFIIAISYLLKFKGQISDPLEVILVLIRIWLIATSIGVLFSLATCFIPEVNKVKEILMRPIFFISGIFFSLQDIPMEWWPYLTWNPCYTQLS